MLHMKHPCWPVKSSRTYGASHTSQAQPTLPESGNSRHTHLSLPLTVSHSPWTTLPPESFSLSSTPSARKRSGISMFILL